MQLLQYSEYLMTSNSKDPMQCKNAENIHNMSSQSVISIRTMEYYSTREIEAVMHARIQMDSEDMLSERSQSQRATYFLIL